MDALIFGVLTIVLSISTLYLFMFLRMVRHSNTRTKLLIGGICTLFTVSYIVRVAYLVFEVIKANDFKCDCCLEYRNAMSFLILLPIFDVFPCATVLSFDAIRFLCGRKGGKQTLPSLHGRPDCSRMNSLVVGGTVGHSRSISVSQVDSFEKEQCSRFCYNVHPGSPQSAGDHCMHQCSDADEYATYEDTATSRMSQSVRSPLDSFGPGTAQRP